MSPSAIIGATYSHPFATSSTTTATQSICPKGWTLPAKTQIDSLSGGSSSAAYVGSFSPVLGGYYADGTLYAESTRGFWWSSTVVGSVEQLSLDYKDNNLHTGGKPRRYGVYIRCVQAS